jgi:hypothetical protein
MERLKPEEEAMIPKAEIVNGEQIGVGFGNIHADERSLERSAELNDAIMRNRVAVDPKAPCCCIDGRHCIKTLDGSKPTPRASIAGGITTPYAAAEMIGWFAEEDSSSSLDRLESLQDYFETAGITMGNHVDEDHEECNYDDGLTGCGASDKMLANIANAYDHPDGVQGFVKALLEGSYNESLLPKPRDDVLARNADWNPVKAKELLATKDGASVEVLHTDETGVHGHRELTVLFNYVEDTTIDRDTFVAETGEQIFVVDMWYIDKLAKAMARGPELQDQYQALRQAMVTYQIGTYLSLCDGSQTYSTLRTAV